MNKKQIAIIAGVILIIAAGYSLTMSRPRAQRAGYSTDASTASVGMGAPGVRTAQLTSAVAYNVAKDAVSDRAEGMGNAERIIAPMPPVSPQLPPEPNQEKRLIIQTGQMSIVVASVSSTIDTISDLAVKNGGYVVEKNFYKSGLVPSGYVTVRIPSASFEKGLGSIRALGDVVSESLNGTDVTAEYVDVESQLRNLRAAETQLLEIMKRSGDISDVLQVQNQLTSIRGQIESYQGRKKYLEQSAAYSLLTVNLSTDRSALPIVESEGETWKPLATFKTALRSLVDLGKDFADLVIWLVAYSPLWLIFGLIIWLIIRKLRPYMTKKS